MLLANTIRIKFEVLLKSLGQTTTGTLSEYGLFCLNHQARLKVVLLRAILGDTGITSDDTTD